MHDALAERQHMPAGQQFAPQRHDLRGGAAMIERAVGPVALRDDGAICFVHLKAREGADALDLAMEELGAVVVGVVDRELDARRAGVENGDAAGLVHVLHHSGNDVRAAVDIDGAAGHAVREGRGEIGAGVAHVHDVHELAQRGFPRRLIQQ